MKVEERISIFIKKEKRQPQAWEVCPRASFCNLNKCPLHVDFSELKNDSSDFGIVHKEKCAAKTIRREIGEYFKLKNRGFKGGWVNIPTLEDTSPEQRGISKTIEKNEVLEEGKR